ncbi:MAG TPA: hypothetical protein VFA63_07860 [Pseudonocardiaceae bacterium]|nr:hypothetical protein [Pseudonocardiaceae bacterium]
MGEVEVVRLSQNPLGAPAPAGQRGDIVRVSNGWATIYLDPDEFDRVSEARLRRMLAEADTRPMSVVGAHTPAGGQGMSIHDAAFRGGLRPRARAAAQARRAGRKLRCWDGLGIGSAELPAHGAG